MRLNQLIKLGTGKLVFKDNRPRQTIWIAIRHFNCNIQSL